MLDMGEESQDTTAEGRRVKVDLFALPRVQAQTVLEGELLNNGRVECIS